MAEAPSGTHLSATLDAMADAPPGTHGLVVGSPPTSNGSSRTVLSTAFSPGSVAKASTSSHRPSQSLSTAAFGSPGSAVVRASPLASSHRQSQAQAVSTAFGSPGSAAQASTSSHHLGQVLTTLGCTVAQAIYHQSS